MYVEKIDPKKTVVMVIDMQNDFISPDGAIFSQMGYDMVSRLNSFLDECRNLGMMIVYTQTYCRADMLDAGKSAEFCVPLKEGRALREDTTGKDIYYALLPKEGDIVLHKYKYSSFFGTNLDSILRFNGIDTMLITGVCTDCCCFSTARDAGFLNYDVAMIYDLCGTVDYEDTLGKGAFSAQQVHDCYMSTMAVTTADVIMSEEVFKRVKR